MKVIVVGAGIMGLCCAWALARRGHHPLVYEQGPVPNPLGSSVDRHRVIRFTYGAMAGYARMVHEAYAAWGRLWADLGRTHYRETGTLVVARAEDGWIRASLASLEAMGLPVERLEPEALRQRLPAVDVSDARWALFTPTGGLLFAERIVADLARHLAERGMPVRAGTPVEAIDPARAAVRLGGGRTDAGDALIVAAGPWVPRLVPGLRGRVVPSRQVVAYLEPPPEHRATWAGAPVLLDQIEAARGGFYVVPPAQGTAIKVGDHGFSLQGEPDRERAPAADEVAALLDLVRGRLAHSARYRVSEARTCFYSVAPDEQFIALPLDRAWVLAGFSGHGFKFGALVGERVAGTLDGERSPAALAAWAAGA